MRTQRGFTLIEVIVVLVLVSVLALAAGTGIVEVARGYAFARENTRLAQKAQVALLRISRELIGLESLAIADGTNVVFTTPEGDRAIAWFASELKLDDDSTAVDGSILTDHVNGFQLTYLDGADQPWTTADGLDNLFSIEIWLSLTRNDQMDPLVVATRISPRNNRVFNAPI